MDAVIRIEGCTAVCGLSGELDAAAASKLRQTISSLYGVERAIIDLGGVTFIDSAGLGVLVAGIRQVRAQGGDLAFWNTPPIVCRVLHVAGLDRIVDINPEPWISAPEPAQPVRTRRHPSRRRGVRRHAPDVPASTP